MDKKLISANIWGMIFFIPLFFSTFAQEYYFTEKFYFFVFITSLLFIFYAVTHIFKKEQYISSFLYLPISTVLITFCFTIFTTQNKGSLFGSPSDTLLLVFCILFAFLAIQSHISVIKHIYTPFLSVCIILSTISLFSVFHPLQSFSLPLSLSFLQNSFFSPAGTPIDLIILLTYGLILIVQIIVTNISEFYVSKRYILYIFIYILIGLIMTLYSFFTSEMSAYQKAFASYTDSFYALMHNTQNIFSLLFGQGNDGFNTAFNLAKHTSFNLSQFWNIQYFQSQSYFLQFIIEHGFISFCAVLFLGAYIVNSLYSIKKQQNNYFLPFYIQFFFFIGIFLFLPFSFFTYFLFTLFLIQIIRILPLKEIPIKIYIQRAFLCGTVLIIGVLTYIIGKDMYGEYIYKQSLNLFAMNQPEKTYELQKKALIYTPYKEKLHHSFSDLNLSFANSLAQKNPFTSHDQVEAGNFIKNSFSEAKAAISLHSKKELNYEHAGNIYAAVGTSIPSARVWAIAFYERALLLDPQNPSLYVSIGTIYFHNKNISEAINFYQQALQLKPDYSEAHVWLAKAYTENGDREKADEEMKKAKQ